MSRRSWLLTLGCTAATTTIAIGGHGQTRVPEAPYTTWRDYGGSPDAMQYWAIAQVDRTNVQQLQSVWFYPVAGDPARLPFNPLVVDDVMYVAGAKGVVVALDAATGKEEWISSEQAPDRGLAYWESADHSMVMFFFFCFCTSSAYCYKKRFSTHLIITINKLH